MDYTEKIDMISEKLQKLLEVTEELKRQVEEKQDSSIEEEVTYSWCCCFRKEKLN